VHYEDVGGCGCLEKAEHDLVVLSVGLLSNPEVPRLFKNERLEVDEMDWIQETEDDVNPGRTSIEGVFVAGSAAGARDIPDTIVHAGAAAVQAAAYVEHSRTGK